MIVVEGLRSSSGKSDEKCPSACGIKMKIDGFKRGHCYR